MATTSGTAELTLPADTQILMTREFDAPRHLVYKAYTTPELVKRWFAGKKGTVKLAEIDLRVGGKWRYAMDANEGFEVAFNGEFREIVENERLVMTEAYEGAPPDAGFGVNTITFEDAGEGRTLMTMLCEYDSKEVRDMVLESGMEGGAQESLDALEQVAVSLA